MSELREVFRKHGVKAKQLGPDGMRGPAVAQGPDGPPRLYGAHIQPPTKTYKPSWIDQALTEPVALAELINLIERLSVSSPCEQLCTEMRMRCL